MQYNQQWKAVCPRCSKPTSSNDYICGNCGKGYILVYVSKGPYGSSSLYFGCPVCNTSAYGAECSNCGANIEGVVTPVRTGWGCSLPVIVGIIVMSVIIAVIYFAVASVLNGVNRGDSADVKEIQQLVQTWTDDLNNRDLAGLKSLMCSGSASQLPSDPFSTRDKIGPLSSAVSNVNVTGDQASATIISTWSNGSHNSETDTFAKESSSWKVCHTVNF